MPHYQTTRRANHRPEDIYAVVADVARYHEFLPLVERSAIRNIQDMGAGRSSFVADMAVGYPLLHIRETFTSQVTADLPRFTITSNSTGHAIRRLEAAWRIVPFSEKSCDIHFRVEYELKSFMMQIVLGGVFDQAVRWIMHAFEKRAASLYPTQDSRSSKA